MQKNATDANHDEAELVFLQQCEGYSRGDAPGAALVGKLIQIGKLMQTGLLSETQSEQAQSKWTNLIAQARSVVEAGSGPSASGTLTLLSILARLAPSLDASWN